MRKIVCYRSGCNHPAKYEIPGPPTLYFCKQCLLGLYPNVNTARLRADPVAVGPSEFKGQECDGGVLAEAERVRREHD